ncbi:exonuclease SbcCD subunit D C-terminal domain-containing protein [Myxosarcina sp. GI1]|uniref:exonuclease SbcCD subunit D n=1 Tax=Myxosarcina sp. GI1 TaxID=1541065 RepID=UPI001C105F21|nr:exonuclease SbcCD subunit D C-terminal domain-containing protein [Myxosarcina sp. GI1]
MPNRLLTTFFVNYKEANIPAVVIAGNHDSANRIDGIAKLVAHVGVRALGRPCKASQGGVIKLDTRNGRLCVAAMPFASERRLLKAEELWEKSDSQQQQNYKKVVSYLFEQLVQSFEENCVNVIMAHLTVQSAKLSHSEVDFYTKGAYSLSEGSIPSVAQYVALGHIHKPQQIPNAAPTYYSGSLIQVDFGEAEEEKGFNLVTVEPNRPAKVEFKVIPCHKPLKVLYCNENNLDEILTAHRQHPGYLKVIVEMETQQMGLGDRVRRICPQTLIIQPKYTKTAVERQTESIDYQTFNPTEEFARYYQEQSAKNLEPAVKRAFNDLYQELSDASN